MLVCVEISEAEGRDEKVDVTLGETVIDDDADLVPVTVALFEGVAVAVLERNGVTDVDEEDVLEAEVEGDADEDRDELTDSEEDELDVGEGEIFADAVPVLEAVPERVTVDVLVDERVTVVVFVEVKDTAAVLVGFIERVALGLIVADIEDLTTEGLAVFVDDFVGAVEREDDEEGLEVLVAVGVCPVFKTTAALFGSLWRRPFMPITPGSPPASARVLGGEASAGRGGRPPPLKLLISKIPPISLQKRNIIPRNKSNFIFFAVFMSLLMNTNDVF